MNIYDIAQEAGVSISTVSRVLNHKENVNVRTREKVEAVLAAHNYKPSAIARGMISKSLRTVAVLTIDIREPHYARTAYTIEREFSRRGYEVMICNTGGTLEETRRYLQIILEKKVDGIILVGSIFNVIGKEPEIEEMLRSIPVVLANGKLSLPNSYSVLVDDLYGISLAVDHLLQKGRRDIYHIYDSNTDSSLAKRKGFIYALNRAGFQDSKKRLIKTSQSIEGGIDAVSKLVKSKLPFNGIICQTDITAAGVLKGLSKYGLVSPTDVAVTGYNNSEYSRICNPRLTTVDNKPELVAMLSVQLLSSLMEHTGPYSSGTIQPELILGETT